MVLDILLLGAPKAGTTALHHYIDQHPAIEMSQPKELHLFDVNYELGVEALIERAFDGSGPGRLRGEATPHNLFVPYAPDRIQQHAPEARFIVLLRDPVQRAYSDWWMYWTRGREHLPFDEAIQENLAQLEEGPWFAGPQAEARWIQYYRETTGEAETPITRRAYVEIGHYADQLQRYFERFGRDRVKVLFAEELRQDPQRLVRDTFTWLGLEADIALQDPVRSNEALGGIARFIYRAANALGVEQALHAAPCPLREMAKTFTARMTRRPAMDPGVRRILSEHFRPHNRALTDLLSSDLPAWTDPNDLNTRSRMNLT